MTPPHFDPYPEKARQAREYFDAHAQARPDLLEAIDRFVDAQSLDAAAGMLTRFFATHATGDTRSLRTITSLFADKRLARRLVDDLLGSEAALRGVAARSYPHPIGFDKLVLHHHRAADETTRDFKLRLHVYWRSPEEVGAERIHLHRFEMASSPITGELTNHLWALRAFDPVHDVDMEARGVPGERAQPFHAYSGYLRDAQGVLHKRYLGRAVLERRSALTFVPGQTYAQNLASPHFVETNAETGHTNGDICSTFYVHGPGLRDAAGRQIPILFEPERLEQDDTIITSIGSLGVDALVQALHKYRALLSESIAFHDWLHDPRYGRNLSVGMVAGYLLSEAFESRYTIQMWNDHRAACVDVLSRRSAALRDIIEGRARLEALGDARESRYFQLLINKAYHHTDGKQRWLDLYGDLTREFERYLGALLGDYARNPDDLRVLKPIWDLDNVSGGVGGAHYGHISAMLKAAEEVAPIILESFRSETLRGWEKTDGEGPVSRIDLEVQRRIAAHLREHFPSYRFAGEEDTPGVDPDQDAGAAPEGARRWLVDPIDGTRNYLHGDRNFAVSIACQRRVNGAWSTTDAVLSLPAHREVFWAERGDGAYLIEAAAGKEQRLRVKPRLDGALADETHPLQGRLIGISARGLGPREALLVERLNAAKAIRRMTGSAAQMLAQVSGCGLTGAIVTAEPHDVVAGLLISREAGGVQGARTFEREGRAFTVFFAAESEAVGRALEALIQGLF